MVNWLDEMPAYMERLKREHPEKFQDEQQTAPLTPLTPLPDRNPQRGMQPAPYTAPGTDYTIPQPDNTPLDPGWADDWRKMWEQGGPQMQQQQQIPPPPAGSRRIDANAGGLLGNLGAITGGGGGGLLGGAGGDTLGGMPLDASSPISMMNPNMQNTPPLAGDQSLLGSMQSDTLPGGGGAPTDDGSNPGFFSRLFGGGRGGDQSIGGNAWGPALMQLGGGIAAGATEGWGAGIGKGLLGAGASLQRSRELAQAEQDRKEARAIQQQQFEEQMKLKREELAAKPVGTSLQQNLLSAGYKPGTPEWKEAMDRAITKPLSSVTMQGESAFEKSLGEMGAKKYAEYSDASAASQGKLRTLDAMEQAASDPNVYQGPGANQVLFLRKLGSSLGMTDIKGNDSATLFNSLTNNLALKARNPAGGEGMPGNLSNTDRDFLVSTVPGITQGREGNMMLIDISRRLEKRKMDEAVEAQTYIEQNGMRGLSRHMQDWSSEQPDLFADLHGKIAKPPAATPKKDEPVDWLDWYRGGR